MRSSSSPSPSSSSSSSSKGRGGEDGGGANDYISKSNVTSQNNLRLEAGATEDVAISSSSSLALFLRLEAPRPRLAADMLGRSGELG